MVINLEQITFRQLLTNKLFQSVSSVVVLDGEITNDLLITHVIIFSRPPYCIVNLQRYFTVKSCYEDL